MFGLVFQNPAVWIGATLLAVPIMIHLLTRHTPRRIVFPTIRFIRKAQSNLSALFRVRHWFLLLVRTLLVMMVLATFLRPYSKSGALAVDDPKAPHRTTMIVIDGSLSMGYSHAGSSPAARAQQAAMKIVDGLGAGDRCNLIVAEALPRATFDEPSDNRFQIRREIQEFKPSLERADFDAAIALAVRQLASIQNMRREIVFISDFQRTNWAGVAFAAIPESIRSTYLSVAESESQNLAITDLRAVPGDPIVDEPVEMTCKVANYGPLERKATLRLKLGNDPPLTRDLELAPGMTISAAFHVRVRKAGDHEVTAEIGGDDLPADNARYLTLPISDKIEALVLTDEAKQDARASHHYLVRALDPFDGGPGGTVHCNVMAPEALTPLDLARTHLVLICGVHELAAPKTALLLDFLKSGGGILYFLTGPADRANIAALQDQTKNDLKLPFEAGTTISYTDQGGASAFVNANFDDPMLRAFREMPELGQIKFRRLLATRRNADVGQVLIGFSDGNVALARQDWESGSLLLCNFSPSPDDGDLARSTLFVPLVHEFVGAMRPQSGSWRAFRVGGACTATVRIDSTPAPPMLLSPSDESLNAVIERRDNEVMVVYPHAVQNGFYRLRAGDRVLTTMPVNVDARESNLDAMTVDEVRELAGASRRQVLAASAGDVAAMERLTEGRMLWPLFLMAGLLLLAVEQSLTLVWRR